MSKPTWDSAPEWANWLAQDSDGRWFWYELEPRERETEWVACGIYEPASLTDHNPLGPKEPCP